MKAITYQQYGSPDVLKLSEISNPIPKDDEVLVKIGAISLNPAEWHGLLGENLAARLELGLQRPKHAVLGADFSGTIEAVGAGVQRFHPGQAVFGRSKGGGFAEYVCVSETRVALKPKSLSNVEAAALPLAGVTALQGLRRSQIQAGDRVLVNGASGGIGTLMVQMARHFGAEVTGVCSGSNRELVRSLGADHVVDYTRQPAAELKETFDLVIDNVGNLTYEVVKRLLAPEGRAVVLGFETFRQILPIMIKGAWLTRTSPQKIGVINANVNTDDLNTISNLVAQGALRSVIDRCYGLEALPQAMSALGSRRVRGKLVVQVSEPMENTQ